MENEDEHIFVGIFEDEMKKDGVSWSHRVTLFLSERCMLEDLYETVI